MEAACFAAYPGCVGTRRCALEVRAWPVLCLIVACRKSTSGRSARLCLFCAIWFASASGLFLTALDKKYLKSSRSGKRARPKPKKLDTSPYNKITNLSIIIKQYASQKKSFSHDLFKAWFFSQGKRC